MCEVNEANKHYKHCNVYVYRSQESNLRGMVRQLSIDQLDNEGRRVSVYDKGSERTPIFAPHNIVSPVRLCLFCILAVCVMVVCVSCVSSAFSCRCK